MSTSGTPEHPDLAEFVTAATVAKLRAERDIAKAALAKAEAELLSMGTELEVFRNLNTKLSSVPRWLTSRNVKKKTKKDVGTICTILSDTHFDEVVKPEEMNYVNAYNRDIAVKRLNRYFDKTVVLTRDYLSGLEYDGIVLFLGGDIFSGDIHEELTETNEDTMLGSLLFWSERLASGISMLAEEFGKVHVPCVVGNHSRRTHKPRAKLRARDNFDWFLAHQLALLLKSDDRITFQIPESTDAIVPVHDTTFLLTHGDQARGGQGIGGLWPPLLRMRAKKLQNYESMGSPFDIMVVGHWHTLIQAASNGLIVNGSLKGWDEYAATSNFSFEAPQQALWVTVPKNGVVWQAPVLAGDRKSEGW